MFRENGGPVPNSAIATGINLEIRLRLELKRGNTDAADPLALWLAFHNRPEEALAALKGRTQPGSRRLAGLIVWKGLHQPSDAVVHLESGPLDDPIAVVELDQLYAELGLTPQRSVLLAAAPPSPYVADLNCHRQILERQADLALTLGQPAQALRLLESRSWPREHQRYVRSDLWKKAKEALGEPETDIPHFLHEDNLARFGAYWSD